MPARKFSPGQVRSIRKFAHKINHDFIHRLFDYKEFRKQMGELSRKYFITHSHLSKIIHRKIYKDLSDE